MVKLTAVLVLVASFLFFAPVIESGTPSHLTSFRRSATRPRGRVASPGWRK